MDLMLADLNVIKVSKDYTLVSQGAMLYYLCPTEYAVDADKKAFSDRMFDNVSREYMDAFAKAHQEASGLAPTQQTVTAYTKYFSDQQTEAKRGVQQLVADQGCSDPSLLDLDAYWTQVRVNESNTTAQPITKN